MSKKDYQKPVMRVVMLQQKAHLLTGSAVRSLNSNLSAGESIGHGGAGDGTGVYTPRSRRRSVWDEGDE